MGVAISDWRLAKAVSQLGQLGVVSGTGISRVMASRLMDGDLSGNVREWCLDRFDPENPDDRRHAIRGGAYCIGDRAELLTSYRQGKSSTSRDNFTGFRIVRAPLRPENDKR